MCQGAWPVPVPMRMPDTLPRLCPRIFEKQCSIDTISVEETLRPTGIVGCASPDYVRAFGKVVDVKEEVVQTTEAKADYGLIVKFNIFCRKIDSSKTHVQINLNINPSNVVHGTMPTPQSTGFFEQNFLTYVNDFVNTNP
jgi:hypothetical protein